jgi:23S rRNA (uracil1939-C5)-methyltransferase
VVIANPPRTGFGRGVADGIAALAPERIVIVSCDPATLARDVKQLATHDYRITRITPIDLFPQTPHTETLTVLQKGG